MQSRWITLTKHTFPTRNHYQLLNIWHPFNWRIQKLDQSKGTAPSFKVVRSSYLVADSSICYLCLPCMKYRKPLEIDHNVLQIMCVKAIKKTKRTAHVQNPNPGSGCPFRTGPSIPQKEDAHIENRTRDPCMARYPHKYNALPTELYGLGGGERTER